MKTKRIISIDDVKNFFDSSINTLEDAVGVFEYNLETHMITINFNGVLLLRFDDVFADTKYPDDSWLFDEDFRAVLSNIRTKEITPKTEYKYRRFTDKEHNFLFKVQAMNDHLVKVVLIHFEKLFETEQQLKLFSNVFGAGVSIFAGCTWWIDYDKYNDHFYQTNSGPELLGIPVNDDMVYGTSEFKEVREKARMLSDFYDEAIQVEQESYERVRRNETNYFGGRTPTVTADNSIIWVEGYGKCILRYPDGTPRFSIAIDIYMSELFEKVNQLEIIRNVTETGLISSEVGLFYYQRHFQEGYYYFTESYNQLMGGTQYTDKVFREMLKNQIDLFKQIGNGYEKYIEGFVVEHNRIFKNELDKYHLNIPFYEEGKEIKWFDIRGTVVERNDEGQTILFVGVAVDVTQSMERRLELENLRENNERLQFAEELAINARGILIWHQRRDRLANEGCIHVNSMFEKKLGLVPDEQGRIYFKDLRKTLVMDTKESKKMGMLLTSNIMRMIRGEDIKFSGLHSKHRNTVTGEILYMEHSVDISRTNPNNPMLGGVLLDVTRNFKYQEKIQYLADFDTLTNTYNRNYFERFIETQLPNSYHLLIFDVDGLKLVNDAFGHMEGDRIIKKLASILKSTFDDALFVSRIGGDEFVVLLDKLDRFSLDQKMDTMLSVIKAYNDSSAIEMVVSLAGVEVNDNDMPFDKAFVQAENLMYRRKLNNRSSRKSKVLDSIIETLNAKTVETKEHGLRMGNLAAATLKELGFIRYNEMEDIRLLAQVHDIGKITIPDNILQKPGQLTESEFEVIKKHCEAGYKIIRNITDSDNVCNGVLFHHERFDGTGYPQGLVGEEIPIFARVITVVDSFDAMTHDRIYQKARSSLDAIEELQRCSGTQFDPKVVEAFIRGFNNNSK